MLRARAAPGLRRAPVAPAESVADSQCRLETLARAHPWYARFDWSRGKGMVCCKPKGCPDKCCGSGSLVFRDWRPRSGRRLRSCPLPGVDALHRLAGHHRGNGVLENQLFLIVAGIENYGIFVERLDAP